ncbi:Ti-type conjugal transfer relaxase TraA (plasmid) [Candidatus Protochlamydia naegleriophila]|uniref:Ti-type conjugal transfer relaxase TraA n=1 Tax=Candidatus Protochlamydia naegleriophila TaxID=389348 RepID=A0A0U5JGX9_9BACT|nr:AAA family ATPase [Candidatus Protochlamydia naegleriophila]CUI18068.1 Ti-type conjugal transfer relaxase TraA [Candidatus Protochlamydia naegleriophila]
MAIGFARLEFVKRSAGKNACAKAAYNGREQIHFNGTSFSPPMTYDWSFKEKPVYHDILLPKGADPSFKNGKNLWNLVEKKENRINSQVALEMVIALPDDKAISIEDRIELIQTFIEEHLVSKGLAVQVDIHQPEKLKSYSSKTLDVEDLEHNWHAHLLITTRRFDESGLDFEDHKARDLMPAMRTVNSNELSIVQRANAVVVNGVNWGALWTQFQNKFFESKGLDLRVDENGIVSQTHLGPVRMRRRAFDLEEENKLLIALNQEESKDSSAILKKITETRSVFNFSDVERFIQKNVPFDSRDVIRQSFWEQNEIVPLIDSKTQNSTGQFSTRSIIEEEKLILRLADSIQEKKALNLRNKQLEDEASELNSEQLDAFRSIIKGKRLSCIEGHAGTGKSYLLGALKNVYEKESYLVRALGPDDATAQVLKEKGFSSIDNVYRFLFLEHHKKIEVKKNEVWIVDETSKLANRPLSELLKLAKKHDAQLVFAGCTSQLPSVERGGLFTAFCERYGAEELVEIQRQKQLDQRSMAQSLASGQMAAAIDKLVSFGEIKWQETKQESIESLVKAWASDQTAFPNQSFLILAHSNSEVRILNEMARLYRKEKGELSDEEFACQTSAGKIYVSVGDKLEFRKKDNQLGVVNGTVATLVDVSNSQFTVYISDQNRRMTFNPEEYNSFQLGYATTYFRSQGQTVDRAYVLHSPQMNKEKFYVGLTRHVHKATLFVSSDETSCLADLKKQAFRKDKRENTLNFTTEEQIGERQSAMQRQQRILDLKHSSSVVSKVKGHSLGLWDSLKSSISSHYQRSKDLKPKEEFFNPKIDKSISKGLVVKIDDQHKDYSVIKSEVGSSFKEMLSRNSQSQEEVQPATKKDLGVKWQGLDDKGSSLLKGYYSALNQSSALYTLVRSDMTGKDFKTSSHFNEWQKSCVHRNAQAFEVMKTIPKHFVQQAMGGDAFQILQDRASKYESYNSQKQADAVSISDKVREKLDHFLYRLFPDGPTGRDAKGLRFGSKHALSVICKGDEAGCYYDFEKGEGGGPVKLVQHVLSMSREDALKWINEVVDDQTNMRVPSQYHFKGSDKHTGEWQSLKPFNETAPDLEKISPYFNKTYNEVARHAYRDQNGDLLFYTLRLVKKSNPSEKMVLPLTYGQWNGSNEASWCLKAHQADKRSLYKLELINDYPKAKILVVEGEKTADAAQKLYSKESMICVSWQGGSGAVAKADWSSLFGRDIVIWPDNDKAGFKAAESIVSELRKTGVKSIKVVNQEELSNKFPDKWDLADPLPNGMKDQDVHNLISFSREKTIGIGQLTSKTLDKSQALEILWRVEERLWSSLEQSYEERIWDLKHEIYKEFSRLVSHQQVLEAKIQSECQNPELSRRISFQLVLEEAHKGKNGLSIDAMKQILTHGNFNLSKDHIEELDKLIASALSLGMSSESIKKEITSKSIDISNKPAIDSFKAQKTLDNDISI